MQPPTQVEDGASFPAKKNLPHAYSHTLLPHLNPNWSNQNDLVILSYKRMSCKMSYYTIGNLLRLAFFT